MKEQEKEICPYCEYEIMYNGPEDFDPVSVDELDNFYHDDCFFEKFGYICEEGE
tara:strand:- start:371 stop:532 length:162 start_codon:yes stop_codon:yes gene_type:complete